MSLKKQYKEDLTKSLKEEVKVELRSRINKRNGLCADCVRAESCSLSHNSDATIWSCEDYENEVIAPVAANTKSRETESPKLEENTAVESNPGLCPYCIHNENCSLKNLEGGIWHCEEYA